MIGITILKHSIRQVAGNIGMALKASAWFFVLSGIAMAFLLRDLVAKLDGSNQSFSSILDVQTQSFNADANLSVLFSPLQLVFVVFFIWGICVVAIVWHRFILLNERPRSIIPYRKGLPVGRYFWTSVGIALITMLILMVLSVVGGVVILATQSEPVLVFINLVVVLIITAFYLRLSLVLPSIAVNQKISISEAWRHSAGQFGTIVGVALALSIFQMVATFAISQVGLALQLGVLTAILNVAFQWFYFMLNISILTTLYGYFVEKRDVF